MPTTTDPTLRLSLTDGIDGLATAQRQLASFLEAADCDPSRMLRAELVVEEAVMNILRHGQHPNRPTQTHLTAQTRANRIHLAIEDDGPEFNPLTHQSAPLATSLETAPIGGHGLRLIRANAAAIRYARTQDGRNLLEVELE